MNNLIDKVISKIKQDELLETLSPLFKDRQVYLVGGYIRDVYLGSEPVLDYDLVVVNENSHILAQEIAQKLEGSLVELDGQNDIYRVVVGEKFFDITSTKGIAEDGHDTLADGKDIFADAKRRDFTLNSIYYDFSRGEIFDPLEGLKDLEKGVLRTYKMENFEDDPLRMLRAFRFASLSDFEISTDILEYIEKNAANISKPAPERINYEIIKMFDGKNLVPMLKLTYKTGLLAEIFPFVKDIEKIPPNSHHHLNLLEHSIETVSHIRINDPFLKLAAFMHDLGKPPLWKIEPCKVLDPKGNLITQRHRFIGHEEEGAKLAKPMLEALKFSRKQIDFITKMISHHIYPSALMHQSDRTEKSLIRFARKISPHTKELLELARADRLSARGVMVVDEIVERNLKNLVELDQFCEKIKSKLETLPKLLDGNEIMSLLNIPPSKKLGEIIAELEEAQLEGIVQGKEDAKAFVLSRK